LIKDRWTIAAVAKNMAGSKKNEFFRPYYMFGSALQFHTRNDYHHFSLVFDLSTKEDIDGKEGMAIKYAGGIEYLLRLNNIALALRGGGGSKSTSYGFGFSVNSVSIDYAFVQMREKTIGDSHKFGVSFKFGKLMERRSSRPSRTIQSEKAQQERIRLTGSIRGDKVHLKWTPVSGSDGYQVLVRKSGTKFRPLHKGVLNTTEMTISAGKRDTEFEFIVKVVSKGKGVAVSNVLRLK
jgi:hypothetical protein